MSGWMRVERKASELLERLLTLLLLLIFVTITLLVILRYVFTTTIIGGNEAALIAFVYTTAIGGALAVARDEHIAIRYFVDLAPPAMRRTMQTVQLLVVAAVNAGLVWYSLLWIDRTGAFLMPALQLPQAVAQLSVPIGCTLAFIYCLLRMRHRFDTE